MSHGHLTVMRECEWDKILPSLIETQTRFPRILHKTDTVETLIKGIETGELYGFILCYGLKLELFSQESDFLF